VLDLLAPRLVAMIAAAIEQPYPNRLAHTLFDDRDARPPRALTPLFWGAFDWHSAVHGHWALVRLVRLEPAAPWAAAVTAQLDRRITAAAVAGELSYLGPRPGFEAPYGLAWLVQLGAELAEARAAGHPGAIRWSALLAPLIAVGAERLAGWLERLPRPIRTGEHNQSAFAMALALDGGRALGDRRLVAAVERRAEAFHRSDRAAPLGWEPDAHDFLSPVLASADLMRRLLAADDFASWLDGLVVDDALAALMPAVATDRGDGKLVHADGLNLSRAWMLRGIAAGLPDGDRRRPLLAERAAAHGAAGLDGIASDQFAGSHWLGSFATYLVTDRGLGR
jgi:hypothetical protein